MVLCLGPPSSGKTLLLKKLQNIEEVDTTSVSVPTVGINVFIIKSLDRSKDIIVREVGGCMASLWNKYLIRLRKLIYVVDTSNLCQISAAGILLYSLLTNPILFNVQILIVLTKMDVSYRQMRNEALLMLQYLKMKKKVKQKITVMEASAFTGEGVNEINNWIFDVITIKKSIIK